jgi:hypothetical protein
MTLRHDGILPIASGGSTEISRVKNFSKDSRLNLYEVRFEIVVN